VLRRPVVKVSTPGEAIVKALVTVTILVGEVPVLARVKLPIVDGSPLPVTWLPEPTYKHMLQ
jgi:hypothetical protein